MEEGRFKKVISSQMQSLNTGMVSQRKSIKKLLDEKDPSVKKRDGEIHAFKKDHLEEVDENVPIHKKDELKLPIIVYNEPSLDQSFVKNKVEGEVIKGMGDFRRKKINREKIWFSKPLVAELIREYDDIFQFVWTPKLNRNLPSE